MRNFHLHWFDALRARWSHPGTGTRYWLRYWSYHFSRHPHRAWPVFKDWFLGRDVWATNSQRGSET